MYLSQFFIPVQKDDPKDAVVTSHKLMLKAGMIRQLGVGLYSWLPLGLKVLRNVEQVIRNQMNNAGAVEMLIPSIQPIDLWKKSGRFGAKGELMSEMLIINDRSGSQLTFAPTAEEALADIVKNNIQSYAAFPKNLYQISWKFRDEIRPRFGVMRAREFLMKDAYSFDIDEPSALIAYEKMFIAYLKAFKMMGLNAIPVKADTGDMGGDLSHEFHILASNGESSIFYQEGLEDYLNSNDINIENYSKFYANEQDKHFEAECKIPPHELLNKRGIEVGHIFYLGDRYTKSMGVNVQDKNGKLIHPLMGCYGIGISRLVAAIIEASHDEKGIIWPEVVSPFDIMLINLKTDNDECNSISLDLYDILRANKKDVLYDDTNLSAGNKFAHSELIGLPWIIVVGPKLAAQNMVEVKQRKTGETHQLSTEAVKAMFCHVD